ncbi:MAG: hypothetical protein F6K42_12980 [Leptolyngbya sp. SIO1D8]|nr:hypothetical protein [Leptolyngbya sp. SIO1D8]
MPSQLRSRRSGKRRTSTGDDWRNLTSRLNKRNKRDKTKSSSTEKTEFRVPWLLIGAASLIAGAALHTHKPGLANLLGWCGLGLLVWRCWKAFTKKWGNPWAIAAWIASGVLGLLLLYLFFQSAHIYASLGQSLVPDQSPVAWGSLGAQTLAQWGIGGWLLSLPLSFLAHLVHGLRLTTMGVVGVLAFAVIQTAECMPRIIRSSPRAMKSMIKAFEKFKKLEPQKGSSRTLSKLYEAHNDYYENFLTGLDTARLVAYTIDLVCCLIGAPIIIGGYQDFSIITAEIDWANVGRIVITLGLFEFVVWVLVQCSKAAYFYSNVEPEKKA